MSGLSLVELRTHHTSRQASALPTELFSSALADWVNTNQGITWMYIHCMYTCYSTCGSVFKVYVGSICTVHYLNCRICLRTYVHACTWYLHVSHTMTFMLCSRLQAGSTDICIWTWNSHDGHCGHGSRPASYSQTSQAWAATPGSAHDPTGLQECKCLIHCSTATVHACTYMHVAC